MKISTQIISQFLHGAEFELPADTLAIDHCIDRIVKVKMNIICTDKKYLHLKRIEGIISTM